MSKYEAILILDDHVYEDGGDAFIDQIESTIQDLSGTITERKSLGRRQFARHCMIYEGNDFKARRSGQHSGIAVQSHRR